MKKYYVTEKIRYEVSAEDEDEALYRCLSVERNYLDTSFEVEACGEL